jgi:hypothetical protein
VIRALIIRRASRDDFWLADYLISKQLPDLAQLDVDEGCALPRVLRVEVACADPGQAFCHHPSQLLEAGPACEDAPALFRDKACIEEIEKQQKTMLAEKHGEVETLGGLLYSNEIQQNFRYSNTLEESLSVEKNTQEDLPLSVREKEQAIRGLKSQIEKIGQEIIGRRGDIELLNEKKQRIDYAQLMKEPTVSLYPVSPKKKMNVLVAGFAGFFCFSILVLFLDYKKKGRRS